MSFNTALTGGQLTKLRSGSYAADYLVTLCANTVVFAGQVNTDLSTVTSWLQFNYNNVTVGAYTDVAVDQVLLISTTNDKTKATYRGRIRLTVPTATVITCSESSQNFAVGAYFWVLDTYDIQYKLSRPDDNGNELVDGTLTYAGLLPEVTGLRTAYCDYVDGTGVMRVAFSVTGYAVESGATISSYAWTFKAASYTVISGSLATAAVTVDFNPGEQWGKLVVTDSGGRTLTRHFYIKAHDASNPPDTGFGEGTLSADLQRGWILNIPAFTGVDSLLPDTFAVMWRANENYGGVAGALDTTNNIAFVGWLQREEVSAIGDASYSVLTEARFEFTGVGARMQRLGAQLLPFTLNASPDAWGEINNLTPWRAICHFLSRYSTVANLCDLDFSSKDNTYLFAALSSQGGNVLQVISEIANQIDANVEFAPDGRIRVDRDAAYLTTGERAALTTVIAYTEQDAISPGGIVKALEENRQVGKVDAVGAFYNSTNGQTTVFTARAPGHAQGEGAGSATLDNQVLAATTNSTTALDELRQRAGNRYEVENMSETLSIDHPDGYHYLIPSRAQVFTQTLSSTLPGANGVNRIVYDTGTGWLLESVTLARAGNGATNVKGNYRRLTRVGDLADNTTVIPPGLETPTVPDVGFPAFPDENFETVIPEEGWTEAQIPPTYGDNGGVVTLKGQEVIAKTTGKAFVFTQFITRTAPHSNDVTPADIGSYSIEQVVFDPFGTASALGAYLLAYASPNSAAWYTGNSLDTVPDWAIGATIANEYKVLRTTNVAGTILIYSPGATIASTNYDFRTGQLGFIPMVVGYGGDTKNSIYTAGTGWTDTSAGLPQPSIYGACAYNFTSPTYVISVDLVFKNVTRTLSGNSFACGVNVARPADGDSTVTITVNATVSGVQDFGAVVQSTGHVTLEQVTIRTGSRPNRVALSNDYGATWQTPLNVGGGPGNVGGFDVQRAGTVSYVASTETVVKATTLGGAYSAFINTTNANAVCIIIPWYTRNSTTAKNTTGATPDCLVALTGNDTDGGSLYWVAGGTGVKTDITPTAGMTFDNPNCVTTSYGTHIAVFGLVGGVYHLYTSTNGGAAWTDRGALTTPGFIRGRRKDNRVATYGGGNHGQLYVTDGNAIDYSYTWKNGSPRTMPVAGIDGFDVSG